jgi:para-aminobenzoate synthetase component 1
MTGVERILGFIGSAAGWTGGGSWAKAVVKMARATVAAAGRAFIEDAECSGKIPFEKEHGREHGARVPKTIALPRVRPIELDFTPVEVAARLRHRPGMCFFDTALESPGRDQLSVLAAAPTEILQGRLGVDDDRLRRRLSLHAGDAPDCGIPAGFLGGWVDYDGAFCFGVYEHALVYSHRDAAWHEVGEGRTLLGESLTPQGFIQPAFVPEMTSERYIAMVRRAQEYIAAGDIYQVNLTHRFSSQWPGGGFGFYEALRHYSPAPYAGFLDLGGRQVLSSSPECFLKISGRMISTRPIKGTRPRRSDALADERSAFDLLTSPKEIAELVMITDLERNDLGQVCDFGTVSVRELLALERFEQVFHLVSTIEGRLRPGVDHLAALAACFPGGSITGAPKRRAREIIAELEVVPRGLYTGAIGWLGFNGESRFNIAIRTVIIEGGIAHFHVGAGIVADSEPAREWQETLDKAAGILLAAERFGAGANRA